MAHRLRVCRWEVEVPCSVVGFLLGKTQIACPGHDGGDSDIQCHWSPGAHDNYNDGRRIPTEVPGYGGFDGGSTAVLIDVIIQYLKRCCLTHARSAINIMYVVSEMEILGLLALTHDTVYQAPR